MKKNHQIDRSGKIVIDFDEKLTTSQLSDVLFELFSSSIKRDGKQFLVNETIGILVCNITHLGGLHLAYKKRIQLKPYYLDYFKKNLENKIKTIYLGIYTYKNTRLFVVFEPSTYSAKKSNNSSAHIYSFNLQYAKKVGKFHKIDSFGNSIYVFDQQEFYKHINNHAKHLNDVFQGDNLNRLILDKFTKFKETVPPVWKGIECYRKLIEVDDPNARQGEWGGFYFEHLFKKFLKDKNITEIGWHGDKSQNGIDLDIKFNKPWVYGDLKTVRSNKDIIGNSLISLDNVVNKNNGIVYYICCLFDSKMDSANKYEVTMFWDKRRDNPYRSLEELKQRYGKRMKCEIKPKKLFFIKIDTETYKIIKKNPFKQGLNSNGKKRQPKLKVKKEIIDALSFLSFEF